MQAISQISKADLTNASARFKARTGIHLKEDDPQLGILVLYEQIFSEQVEQLRSATHRNRKERIAASVALFIAGAAIAFGVTAYLRPMRAENTLYEQLIGNAKVEPVQYGDKVYYMIPLSPLPNGMPIIVGYNVLRAEDGKYYLPIAEQ